MKIPDIIMLGLFLLRLIWTLQYKESENLQSDMQQATSNTRQPSGQAMYAVVQSTVLYCCNEDEKKKQCVCIREENLTH